MNGWYKLSPNGTFVIVFTTLHIYIYTYIYLYIHKHILKFYIHVVNPTIKAIIYTDVITQQQSHIPYSYGPLPVISTYIYITPFMDCRIA